MGKMKLNLAKYITEIPQNFQFKRSMCSKCRDTEMGWLAVMKQSLSKLVPTSQQNEWENPPEKKRTNHRRRHLSVFSKYTPLFDLLPKISRCVVRVFLNPRNGGHVQTSS